MRLFYTKRSPYARKVRVTAHEKNIPLSFIEEDLTKKSNELIETNPLGKIPALVLDNGEVLCDSPVICEYLDSLKDQPALIPQEPTLRFKTLSLAALADGVMDVTVTAYMEKIRHPDNFHEPFIKSQEETIGRCLKFFDLRGDELKKISIASIAVACAIGYIDFRLSYLLRKGDYPQLLKWFEEFSKRSSMALSKPIA